METATYDPTGLRAGDYPVVHKKGTVASGQGALARGTVLGAILLGAASSAAKSGGNTGNGTLTLDVTTPILAGAQPGVYTARCITAATNSGTFRVEDPNGTVLGDVAVGATFSDDVKFVIADGGTDFVVGDGFDITIAAGSGKVVKSVAAAVDGSAVPVGILAADADATSADVDAPYYISGEWAGSKLTFGAGHTADTVEASFRKTGTPIFIKTLG